MFRPVRRLELHHYNPALELQIAKRDRRSKRGLSAPVDLGVIVNIWNAAEELYREAQDAGNLFYARQFLAVQFQIAHLQRTRVTMEIDREWIEDDWWVHPGRYEVTIGGETRKFLTKGRKTESLKPMAVPLVGLVRDRLDKLLALAPKGNRFLLSSHRLDWPWPSNRYNINVLDQVREHAGESRETWWPHRVRKVAATLLRREGVPRHQYRLAMSHTVERDTAGRFYEEEDPRMEEKREAIASWNHLLQQRLKEAEGPELLAIETQTSA